LDCIGDPSIFLFGESKNEQSRGGASKTDGRFLALGVKKQTAVLSAEPFSRTIANQNIGFGFCQPTP